mmetsp:Transcript_46868/g.135066  ORF Transcript_46868/g.135066 Transcript_46868/m.135066 type:complete len:125 (+) Transcript_46868:2-376(+)
MMMSIFASVQGLSCAKASMQPGQPQNYLMRTAFVAITMLIAGTVPNFGVIFEFFASLCSPVICFFVPIIGGAAIRKSVGAKGAGAVRSVFQFFLLLLGLFCLVIGLMSSVADLRAELAKGSDGH